MVLARNLRITFSHRSAPAGTLLNVAGSRTSPAVWSLALWHVAQYLPITAPASWGSEACADADGANRADGEINAATASIVRNLVIGSRTPVSAQPESLYPPPPTTAMVRGHGNP